MYVSIEPLHSIHVTKTTVRYINVNELYSHEQNYNFVVKLEFYLLLLGLEIFHSTSRMITLLIASNKYFTRLNFGTWVKRKRRRRRHIEATGHVRTRVDETNTIWWSKHRNCCCEPAKNNRKLLSINQYQRIECAQKSGCDKRLFLYTIFPYGFYWRMEKTVWEWWNEKEHTPSEVKRDTNEMLLMPHKAKQIVADYRFDGHWWRQRIRNRWIWLLRVLLSFQPILTYLDRNSQSTRGEIKVSHKHQSQKWIGIKEKISKQIWKIDCN